MGQKIKVSEVPLKENTNVFSYTHGVMPSLSRSSKSMTKNIEDIVFLQEH